FRRFNISHPGPLNAVYMDQLIDVSDIASAGNDFYELSFSPVCQEDITPPVISLAPPIKTSRRTLALHESIHSEKRPYICVLCSAAFRSREDLNVHKKLHPGNEYPYSCKVCGKGFKIKLCCEKHAEKCASQFQKKSVKLEKDDLEVLWDSINNYDLNVDQLESSQGNSQSQIFQFDDSQGSHGICKMEMLEGSIEDGIDFEVDEQMLVLTNEGDNSVLQVIPSDYSVSGFTTGIQQC
ncbi:Zinc finger protein, partial [Armadillidium nasatum]